MTRLMKVGILCAAVVAAECIQLAPTPKGAIEVAVYDLTGVSILPLEVEVLGPYSSKLIVKGQKSRFEGGARMTFGCSAQGSGPKFDVSFSISL